MECSAAGAVDEASTSTTRRQRRRRTRDVCRPLRHWLYGHRDAPYPSRADKLQLATDTQLSLTQVVLGRHRPFGVLVASFVA